jgi:DNA-binding CsgD family transcriptional regulator
VNASSSSASTSKAKVERDAALPRLEGLRAGAGIPPALWQFFRTIFQNAPEAIAMLDASMRVVVWNKAAVALTGYAAADLLGRRCTVDGTRITLELAAGAGPTGDRPPRMRLTSSCEFRIVKPGAPAPAPLPATVIPLQYDGIVLLMLFRTAPWAVDETAAAHVGPDVRRARLARAASRSSMSPARQLTHREQEILRLLAAGKTAKAIATDLSLSLPTVRSHTQHILRKLGVHSALEAVVWFLRGAADGGHGS